MPRTIDELFTELSEPEVQYRFHRPFPPEETISAAPEKGLVDYIAPFLPFYRQFTKETPWQSPETAMEAIGWGMGGLMRGPGMPGTAASKGVSAIRKALGEMGERLLGKRGVPATTERGPWPAVTERGFTREPSEVVDVSPIAKRIRRRIPGVPERKQIPQFAGPTASTIQEVERMGAPPRYTKFPGGIPLRRPAYTIGTRMERQAEDIQYVIEDLLRESLRAKGFIE